MKSFLIIIALLLSNFFYVNAKVSDVMLGYQDTKHSHEIGFLSDNLASLPEDNQYDDTLITESGKFKIHYDLSGINAVKTEDKNKNGIPDYVDSVSFYFDFIYDKYVNELGFKSPIPDDIEKGRGPYNVFITENGNYHYLKLDDSTEILYPGGYYGKTYPNKEIFPRRTFKRSYSYLEIDNNYSPKDSALRGDNKYKAYTMTGIEGLKVTIAHEFHHAVQMVYGIDNPYSSPFYEMLSVFMEEYIFPDVDDYHQYVNSLYRNLSALYNRIESLSADAGYRHALFLLMLHKKYDFEIIKKTLEYVYDGTSMFKALDKVIKDKNPDSSIEDEWCEYKQWIYFSGKNAKDVDEDKRFDDAELFIDLQFPISQKYVSPIIMYSNSMNSFDLQNFRLVFEKAGTISDDTLDVIVANKNTDKIFNYIDNNSEYILSVAENNSGQDMIFLDELGYYFKFNTSDNLCYNIYTRSGQATVSIDNAYPNPFKVKEHNNLYLPAPKEAVLYEKVKYVIYSSDMIMVNEGKLQVTPEFGKRSLRLEETEFLQAGVYFFSVHYYDKVMLGKFAVIGK